MLRKIQKTHSRLESDTMSMLITILLIIIGWIGWKFYSNKHYLPCPSFLSWMVELDNPFAKAHKANVIINSLPLKKGVQILDVGCGPGRILIPLAKKIAHKDGHITGLDLQVGMLQKAMAKAKELNLDNINFIHSNIDTVPINNTYDIILMICVLGEIPKMSRKLVIEKIAHHLNENGIISITETIFDPHFQNHKQVSEMMLNIGFVETNFIGNKCAYTAHFTKVNKD